MNKLFISLTILLILIGLYLLSYQITGDPIKALTVDYGQMIKEEKGTAYTTPDLTRIFLGTILAGKESPYIKFNTSDYEKARKDNKTIFLEFYANWCPICRAQEPKLFEGFNSLTDINIVGFRVNYNDDETDTEEKQLAKDFDVKYQHTHILLKDGKVVSKSSDQLDKDSFLELVTNVP